MKHHPNWARCELLPKAMPLVIMRAANVGLKVKANAVASKANVGEQLKRMRQRETIKVTMPLRLSDLVVDVVDKKPMMAAH